MTADLHAAFLCDIAADPTNPVHRLIYADWLDERGLAPAAGKQRLTVALRRVLATPADDALRLEYASVCEQYGQPERAEFVRVQVELDRIKVGWDFPLHQPPCGSGCHACRLEYLRRREGELVWNSARGWVPELLGHPAAMDTTTKELCMSNKTRCLFRRGFVAEVTLSLGAWCGERCPVCQMQLGAGVTFEAYNPLCHVCHGSGRLSGHGVALMREAPLERVTTDREPSSPVGINSPLRYHWFNEESHQRPVWLSNPHHLPGMLFDLLPDGELVHSDIRDYPTRQAALDALSVALLLWAGYKTEQRDAWAALAGMRGETYCPCDPSGIMPCGGNCGCPWCTLRRRERELAILVGERT